MTEEVLQVIGTDGSASKQASQGLDKKALQRIYRMMVLVRTMDERGLKLQRQGRIHFYVPSWGQEAAQVGAVEALQPEDWLFPSYRDPGMFLNRGFPLQDFVRQLFGNANDPLKGRQMPNHFAAREQNCMSISSPIATQIPQAVGAAMAAKIRGDKTVVLVSFGDGGTSEGDFHVAMNFAGVYASPVVFFCQNNQYAISVPTKMQTGSKDFAVKARAYGFEGVKVDGNDVLAVYQATKKAVDKARSGGGPTLIEAVTYRMGPHSSSDDPTRYRSDAEVEEWKAKDPIDRFRGYLEGAGAWDEAFEKEVRESCTEEIASAIKAEEKVKPPPWETIFTDVFARMPRHLQEQLDEIVRARSEDPNFKFP
ncbi:MAG: pyruvate dehydrogenase (acetyl-transferring) E1 component subunit alpha [Planctomycetota bacterium]|nr:pyruvate dehydrogenase (acetyl-transferring) E1 component subunit alpha [Planctomycetota bacterium]